MIGLLLMAAIALLIIGYVIGRWGRNATHAQLRDSLEFRRQTIADYSSQLNSQYDEMTIQRERITILERENSQLKAIGREVAKFAEQQFPSGG